MRTLQRQPIDTLFPRVRTRVLSLLLLNPEARWHVRDIVRRSGSAVGSVHRELKGLTSAGIIDRVGEGARPYYQVNTSCPFLAELSGLMRKTGGLADVVKRALGPLSAAIDAAFIYGSQAGGTATERSDVDLLVVGDVDEMLLHRAVSKAEAELARPVNYMLLSRKEFARRRREKAGFLARVLAGDKMMLFGDPDALR